MFYCFETEKAVQAAGVLLGAHPGQQMSSLRLVKLLYLADRENLKTVARPIIGNPVVAKADGPAHGELSSIINGEHPDEGLWSQFIHQDGYLVRLVDDPGVLDLSQQEIQTLNSVAQSHCTSNDWDLVELTRELPEWKKNYVEKETRPIPIDDILDAVGWSADDKAAILEEIAD